MRLIHTEKASKVQLFTCCCFKVASTRRNIATASGNFAVSVILSLICWSYRAGNQNQLQCPPRFRCASIRPSNFPNVLRDFKLSARFWAFEIVPFLLKHQQTRWTRRKIFFMFDQFSGILSADFLIFRKNPIGSEYQCIRFQFPDHSLQKISTIARCEQSLWFGSFLMDNLTE